MANETGGLQDVLAAYADAVLAKDADRLSVLYAPDVRVFDAWGVWSFEGRDSWKGALGDWLGSLGEERVQVSFDEVRLVEREAAASVSAIVTYAAIDPAGHVLRAMQNRLSWFLTRADGRWVVAHEHTSAPIDFDHQTAILRRA